MRGMKLRPEPLTAGALMFALLIVLFSCGRCSCNVESAPTRQDPTRTP